MNIIIRLAQHKNALTRSNHPNALLQNSFNKYGSDAFHFCIVEECKIDDLLNIEQLWIDSIDHKYNLSLEASCVKLSVEGRKKISDALRGKKRPYMKRDCSNRKIKAVPPNWTGKRHTSASKLKISDALSGKKRSAEQCKNIALGLKRRKERLDLEKSLI